MCARPVALLVAVLLVAAGVTWSLPVPSAQAITATNASGYPGDVVTVTVQNQQQQTRTEWTISAPAQTTFAAAPVSANPPGTQPFTCPLASPTRAVCGPAGRWAAGNRVESRLSISPNAPVGRYTGSTTIGTESTSFVVDVLRPPAPPVATPADGGVATDRTPTITGSKRTGNSVAVEVDGATVCTVAAGPSTDWRCPVESPLGFGPHALSATQSSPAGDTSPPTTASFTVVDQLQITAPDDGKRTIDRSPEIAGSGALPGAAVTVTVGGQALTATADDDGHWTVTPATALDFGPQTIAASWQVSGQTLEATPVAITVVPKPPVISAPADGARTFDRRPEISGSGAEAGATVAVTLDGQTSTTTAGQAGAWTVTPQSPLTYARQTVTATQLIAQTTSDQAASSFTVAELQPPTITSPAAGSGTTNRRPVLSGNAEPGASVTVVVGGRTLTARADRTGRWQTSTALPLGTQTFTAVQAVGSVTSDSSGRRSFTVVAPPVGPPGPGTGTGGSNNGGANNGSGSANTNGNGNGSANANGSGSANDNGGGANRTSGTTNGGGRGPATAPSPPTTPKKSAAPTKPAEKDDAASSTPGEQTGADASGDSAGNPNNYLPVSLNLAAATLTPGKVSSFVGTLGPNAAAIPVTVTLSGAMNRGMLYRSVESDPAGTCTVTTQQFTCSVTLQPGQSAVLQVRVLADANNAPAYARQQLTIAVPGAEPNTSTVTSRINRPTEVSTLAAAITKGPGTFVILLTLYLFALAATEYERRHPRT